MSLPAWARDWRVLAGGAGLLGGLGLLLYGNEAGWFFAPLGVALPSSSAPPRGNDIDDGPQLMTGPLIAVPGRTYFVAVETNGSVDAAATAARVKVYAEKQGFRDVVVFEDERPSHFPGRLSADYFVRGTFTAETPRELPRNVSVFLGSGKVLEAWEA